MNLCILPFIYTKIVHGNISLHSPQTSIQFWIFFLHFRHLLLGNLQEVPQMKGIGFYLFIPVWVLQLSLSLSLTLYLYLQCCVSICMAILFSLGFGFGFSLIWNCCNACWVIISLGHAFILHVRFLHFVSFNNLRIICTYKKEIIISIFSHRYY